MTLTHKSRHEQGFTLVELAIVMVIIGILIGGILKGQELIANSKISSTVSQVKGTDAAFNTFFDKYNAVPGDISNATTRLPNCAAATVCGVNGGGNGRIDTPAFGTLPTATQEAGTAFVHLSHADLVSGIDDSAATIAFGRMLPVVRVGGGMWVSYAGAAIGNGTTLATPNHYAILGGLATATATTGSISGTAAAQIDRKLDDGLPQAGSTQTFGTNCINAGVYDETTAGSSCTMYIRSLN